MGPMKSAKGFDKIQVKWIAKGTVPLARDKRHRVKWLTNAAAALVRDKKHRMRGG